MARPEINLTRERHVSDWRLYPAPPVYLENATIRNGADRRQVPRAVGIDIVQTVHAAHHIGKSERTKQSLADPIVLEGSERRVFGFDFAAVGEFEAPGPQTRVIPFKPHKDLFRKNQRRVLTVVVRREVRATQP